MAAVVGCDNEIVKLIEECGINPDECTGCRIDIGADEIVTITPTLIFQNERMARLRRVIQRAKADGHLIVKPTEIVSANR